MRWRGDVQLTVDRVPLSSAFTAIKEKNLKYIPDTRFVEDQNNPTYCLLFTVPFPESENAGNKGEEPLRRISIGFAD